MSLSDYKFEELLPAYLRSSEKDRIKEGLEQFFNGKDEIDYSKFYVSGKTDYLMQTDLLDSVFGVYWDNEAKGYESGYVPGFLISNSCDVTDENKRNLNEKDALFAPIVKLSEFISDMEDAGQFTADQLQSFKNSLKQQAFSNLFYLPEIPGRKDEYFVRFDRIFCVPKVNLTEIQKNLSTNRIISLSYWGHFLFLVKYSYHSCRLPEVVERPYTDETLPLTPG